MKISFLKIYLVIASCLCLMTLAENGLAVQVQKTDAAKLRKSFVKAVGQEFEIVRDEMKKRPQDTVSDYWLVHVKPERSGYYTFKYTYKFIKSPNNYPEEGENEINIGVGGKVCHRRNNAPGGIVNFCLGDTIIIPIRTTNVGNHEFSLERRDQGTESLKKSQKEFNSFVKYTAVDPVYNQLEASVKLLGINRAEMPHRSCCAVTFEYYAVFEALKPGRFNLGLSSFSDTETPNASLKLNAQDGTPIIIVNPGTPVTALIPDKKTINYGDNKRFSAHAGNSFVTNLLILQPGDIFVLSYSRFTLDYGFGNKLSKDREIPNIKPAIYKLPFMPDKNWSFNDWLVDYLPK